MSETTDTAPRSRRHRRPGAPAKKAGAKGLGSMLLPELRQLAGGLGIKTAGMRKGDLVEAIKAAQGGGNGGGRDQAPQRRRRRQAGADRQARQQAGRAAPRTSRAPAKRGREPTGRRAPAEPRGRPSQAAGAGRPSAARAASNENQQGEQQPQPERPAGPEGPARRTSGTRPRRTAQPNSGQNSPQNGPQNRADDDAGGSRRNRRRRGRDRGGNQGAGPGQRQPGRQPGRRKRRQPGRHPRPTRNEPDLQILEDDVLAPCAGILDLLDNYAFVRTSGYLPGPDDVYVSMSMVRKYGLRRGDAVTGQVRQPREGERKEKYNPLVKIDTVNGAEPEISRAPAWSSAS